MGVNMAARATAVVCTEPSLLLVPGIVVVLCGSVGNFCYRRQSTALLLRGIQEALICGEGAH